LSDHPISWCCIDRLSWQEFLVTANWRSLFPKTRLQELGASSKLCKDGRMHNFRPADHSAYRRQTGAHWVSASSPLRNVDFREEVPAQPVTPGRTKTYPQSARSSSGMCDVGSAEFSLPHCVFWHSALGQDQSCDDSATRPLGGEGSRTMTE
jgi:hypothetical protein